MSKSMLLVCAFVSGLLLACAPRGAPDGDVCEVDGDCASERCVVHDDGMNGAEPLALCGGSDCHDDDDCEAGWGCRTYLVESASFLGVFDDDEYASRCFRRCDACPERFACAAVTDEWCTYDPEWGTPHLSLTGPDVAHDGQEVTLEASATSDVGLAIDRIAWQFGDGSAAEGATVRRVLGPADHNTAGTYLVRASAVDVDGHTAEALLTITRCLTAGATCYTDGTGASCCAGACVPTASDVDSDTIGACG